MIFKGFGYLLLILLEVLLCRESNCAQKGPGHHKGLYGITRKNNNKNNDKKPDEPKAATNKTVDTKIDSKKGIKVERRSNLEQVLNVRRSKVEIAEASDLTKTVKKDLLVKTPVEGNQIVGNTAGTGSSTGTTEAAKGGPGQASPNVDARSASSNMITDLTVPKMGEAIHGTAVQGNGSEKVENATETKNETTDTTAKGDSRTASSNMLTDITVPKMGDRMNQPVDNANQTKLGNDVINQTAQDVKLVKNADSAVIDVRSPIAQVPKLGEGASIVGIADNSNGSSRGSLVGKQEGVNAQSAGLDARSPTAQIPKLGEGASIVGIADNSNNTDVSKNASLVANETVTNTTLDVRSPDAQIPKLGASIVGIVDNSNSTDFSNRASLTGNQTVANSTLTGQESLSSGGDFKIRSYLDKLDDIANSTAETAKLVNESVQEIKSLTLGVGKSGAGETKEKKLGFSPQMMKDVSAKKKHEIIGPGYYEPECDDEKKCPDGRYCRMYVCVECHRTKHACTDREQCCNKMECVYGRCEDKPKGSPGAFCHKDKECAGEACCVLEPTVDEEHEICKPKLSEYHQCSPILYRKIWLGDNKPDCGPCKGGLQCVQRGVEGSHEVCMKKT
eukprot:Seg836.13 transcript_id=Seg836.13/GoldUCD/mRNA.D3Y31 product="hypothetical protein" protein_id=Seg836.13/GoldUCD/D3Y31